MGSIIINFDAQIVPDMAIGSPSNWLLCPLQKIFLIVIKYT